MLTWIILFSLLGSILSVLAAALFLLLPAVQRDRWVPYLVSFAVGALLGAAFLALIPHALTANGGIEPHRLGLAVLLGVLGFFVLEKMVLWRHCHSDHCEVHAPAEHQDSPAAGVLVLIGDAVHNTVDGVLIAAAFLTDFELGVVTALAVAAHEIPQELGDFAILLHSGFSRVRALVMNLLVGATTLIGAVGAYYSLAGMLHIVPYVLAVAAASFIYIAVADLIPGLHRRPQFAATLQQIGLIGAGIVLIYLAHSTLH